MPPFVDQDNHFPSSVEATMARSAAAPAALRAVLPPGVTAPRPKRPFLERLRSVDRVVLFVAATLLALAVFAPAQAVESLQTVAGSFAGVAPWFAASVLL